LLVWEHIILAKVGNKIMLGIFEILIVGILLNGTYRFYWKNLYQSIFDDSFEEISSTIIWWVLLSPICS